MVRQRRNLWRSVRKTLKRVFTRIISLIAFVCAYIGGKVANAWRDITLPFVKMQRSVKSLSIVMKSTENRGRRFRRERIRLFFKYGWLWNKYLIRRLMNYLFPIVSLAVCVLVVFSVAHLNYAIAIQYSGQTVGYVESESVYDNACRIIQNRMIDPQDIDLFQDTTVMRVAVVEQKQLDTQEVLAEKLLTTSGDVKPASGVYIGGTFYGATTAPDLVKQSLRDLLVPYEAEAAQWKIEGLEVKFARETEFVDGVYPVSSILPHEDLTHRITSATPQDITYQGRAGESPYDIATQNGLSLEQLKTLNPDAKLDKVLQEDALLLVAQGEPLLRVKTVKIEHVTEEIPFQVIPILVETFASNYAVVKTPGVPGERIVTIEYEFVDGKQKGDGTRLQVEITKQPVNQEVVTGTKSAVSGGIGDGNFIWPTADSYYRISQYYNSPVHNGVDITGPNNTPIFAADDGVVIVTRHVGDYGNYVRIDHRNTYETIYAHLNSWIVNEGDFVKKGDVIGFMGSTGRSSGTHLHFEVFINGSKVNPWPFIEQYYDGRT